ncbi:unnamed protein product [Dovyalis caffra]|uniref:Uncharacterized protein n=1 Tax=Dovyalis caffra TaxID=77055 RepID=A0AAV1QTS4_9ROSI|nr:unnamed protein product [Dovyalis caffra]CAK7324756.1 unnamed protein product [Dovyalis caffra]
MMSTRRSLGIGRETCGCWSRRFTAYKDRTRNWSSKIMNSLADWVGLRWYVMAWRYIRPTSDLRWSYTNDMGWVILERKCVFNEDYMSR